MQFSSVIVEFYSFYNTATVEQWVRALVLQAEGWVLESKPRQIYIAKTGSDSSTANTGQ